MVFNILLANFSVLRKKVVLHLHLFNTSYIHFKISASGNILIKYNYSSKKKSILNKSKFYTSYNGLNHR